MKRIIISAIILSTLHFQLSTCKAAIEGGVMKTGAAGHSVVDKHTGEPLAGAKISLPKHNYSTRTNSTGGFDLVQLKDQALLSVEKDGYRMYCATIDGTTTLTPMVLGVEKSNAADIHLESDLIHLGDDSFSNNSANSGEFRAKSAGAFYTKSFRMGAETLARTNHLVIGSIVGIDTLMARSMGQNRIIHSYASAPEVYFNGNKIGEVHLNGDNQRIKLPNNLIRPDKMNEITLKAGKNLMQTAYVDYDDIEFMNLSVQSD
jgi:hypothetical protein